MEESMRKALLLVAALLLSGSAFAGSFNLVEVGTLDARCSEAKSITAWYLNQMQTNGETVGVVCDDHEFEQMAANAARNGGNRKSDNAFSFKTKDHGWIVIVRAGALLGDTRSNRGFTPEHILAHELGHIQGGSVFCDVAEKYATRAIANLKPYVKTTTVAAG